MQRKHKIAVIDHQGKLINVVRRVVTRRRRITMKSRSHKVFTFPVKTTAGYWGYIKVMDV